MIAYIKGEIIKKTEKSIIINTGTIGYLVNINKNIISEIQENQETELYIHSHIREDTFDLYGFNNYEELEFFKTLISISGIGPKVGLEMLNISPNKLKSAIINEDVTFICTIPGIGKKTAQRIILELKGKVQIDNIEELKDLSINEDIIEALINLGYQRKHIVKTLEKAPENIEKEEELITFFLQNA